MLFRMQVSLFVPRLHLCHHRLGEVPGIRLHEAFSWEASEELVVEKEKMF
jgi:hypothetical protein